MSLLPQRRRSSGAVRKTNWQSALHDYIDSKRKTPHKWGSNDCALFSANAVKEITGMDYAKDFRGKYRSRKGAFKVLKERGCKTVEDIANLILEPIKPEVCMKGDVVSIIQDGEPSLGVCVGHIAAFPGPDGITFVSMSKINKAWEVD